MRKPVLFGLLLVCTFCRAQLIPIDRQKHVDSLNATLKGNFPDSLKAMASFDLSKYWILEKNTTKAKYYLENAKKHIQNSRYLQALYTYGTGWLYMNKDNDSVKKYFPKADAILATLKTKSSYLARSSLWRNYTLMVQLEGDNEQAVDIMINKVIPFSQLSGNQSYLGLAYVNLAIIFDNLKQSDKATVYWQKSMAIFESQPLNIKNRLIVYINGAKNNITRNKLAQARVLLNKSKVLLTNYTNTSFFVDYCETESSYFLVTKQYQKSLYILNKGMNVAEKLNLDRQKAALLSQKYHILTAQKKYEEAKNVILKIVEMTEQTSFLDDKISDYQEVYKTYDKLNNIPEAYKWLQKYTFLRDSANRTKLKEEINKLEVKFRNTENQKRIMALDAENKQTQLVLKNNKLTNLLLIGSCIFLLLVVIFIVIYFKKSAVQKERDLQQKAKELVQLQQIAVSKAMIEAEEKERNRMAIDLHDGLGGMLAGVKINLSSLANRNEMESHNFELQKIINQLDGSVTELRNIARNMMPQTLINFGLETALKEFCETMMAPNFRIDFEAFNIDRNIPFQKQAIIYRIVQEILTNAIKHADATEIVLQCSQNQNRFYITVEDNGKGFYVNATNLKSGMGLGNIKNRVEYLGGILDISSEIDEGTTINIELDTN